jgi:Bacterial Ig domain
MIRKLLHLLEIITISDANIVGTNGLKAGVSQPTHGNLKSTGSFSRYTYTPNPGFSGIDSFQYSVT